MRMIVEAFSESLETGLSKPGQIVVSIYGANSAQAAGVFPWFCSPARITSAPSASVHTKASHVAHGPNMGLWLANGQGNRRLPRARHGYVNIVFLIEC